jgi:hypothetical protein
LFQLGLELFGDSSVKDEPDFRNLEEVFVLLGTRHPIAGLVKD